MVDADSRFVVRLTQQRAPHRFIDAALGDVVAVPARGALRVGFDGACGVRHEKLSEYYDDEYGAQPERRPHTMDIELDVASGSKHDVIATPAAGSVVHFDDAKKGATYSRKPKPFSVGASFGPATDLRMRLELRDARSVAERAARIRGVIVDDPSSLSTLFFRRALSPGADAKLITVLVAIGTENVRTARRFVLPSLTTRRTESGDIDALLWTFEDDESVSAAGLFQAMAAHGDPVSDDLLVFVVEQCAQQALQVKAFGLDDLRIRIRDGAPVLTPWARRTRNAVPGSIIDRALRRTGDYRDVGLVHDENATAKQVIERLHALRTTRDDEARAQLKSLVQAWFPSRLREREDFAEQASIIDPARIATWQVPDTTEGDEHDDDDDGDDYAPW